MLSNSRVTHAVRVWLLQVTFLTRYNYFDLLDKPPAQSEQLPQTPCMKRN